MRQLSKLTLSLTFILSSVGLAHADRGFTGSEHKAIGDNVNVTLPGGKQQAAFMNHLENGLTLTYGELIAMGDFFGVADKPISKGATEAERVQRFIDAYNTIGLNIEWVDQARLIVKAIHQEEEFMRAAIERGESPSEAYPKIAGEIDRQYNCATGGGCEEKYWWLKQGRHIKLEENNYDHFGDTAWLAYSAGHRAAMNEAVEASIIGDISHLYRAYAMNAFACHFLTDRYASGHIRTPRVELADHVTPKLVGDLLAKFMHDEESYGLDVHNAYGQKWRAYGDSNYFETKNDEHRRHISAALQKSADEIYQAYRTGQVIEDDMQYNMLPFADEQGAVCKNDIASLFYWDAASGTLYRRWELAKPNECSWTKWWAGWTTLSKLIAIKGAPVLLQGKLAVSEFADQAVKAGLITDKSVVEYVNSRQSNSNK